MLPENLRSATEIKPQGEPVIAKYTDADILRGAYFLLLNELDDGPLKDKILNKKDRPEVFQFAREAAWFADDPSNKARIEKFLTNHPDKCKINV